MDFTVIAIVGLGDSTTTPLPSGSARLGGRPGHSGITLTTPLNLSLAEAGVDQ